MAGGIVDGRGMGHASLLLVGSRNHVIHVAHHMLVGNPEALTLGKMHSTVLGRGIGKTRAARLVCSNRSVRSLKVHGGHVACKGMHSGLHSIFSNVRGHVWESTRKILGRAIRLAALTVVVRHALVFVTGTRSRVVVLTSVVGSHFYEPDSVFVRAALERHD